MISRRRFVCGMAALPLAPGVLRAASVPNPPPLVLRGNRFDLGIDYQRVNFTGQERLATSVNGSLPAPILRWREGERVTLRVTNRLAEDTSIHWHGLILPAAMDGVPGLSFPGIRPGETFEYAFDVRQSGTYWYHSHSGFQEQTGLYGAIVIDPREPDADPADRDYVVVLSDWSDDDPAKVFATLKKASHYYNVNPRTAGDLWRDIRDKGAAATWSERAMWNRMRMSDRDIADVTGYTYTFLMNGQTPAQGWTGLFKRGEKVRLRFINAAAMTFFDVRIPGLSMTVVAADGQAIEPVTVDEFRFGPAETYDVIVSPADDRAWSLFAQAVDRSGYARGTLTPDPSLTAEVPALDPFPVLTHADMGMTHDAHGSHGDHQHHGAGAAAPSADARAGHGAMGRNVDHSAHADHAMAAPRLGRAGHGSDAPVVHAPSERGPGVEMRAPDPQYRLADPGAGLRDNGRRVLTYADLRNRHPTPDPREPGREIQLHLTGNMARYMWSFDGIPYAHAEPLRFRLGERLRITLVNDTMMHHPIHLHGMWSDLETGDGARIPRKHTVTVQPGARISYLVTADAPGKWAYHCHLLYHMGGMFREVHVAGEGGS
ncbi:MAG: copper resistance system multicopper oxidase [Porticoccaceae bacterium]